MAKKTGEDQVEYKAEEKKPTGYPLIDPDAAHVSHAGVIYEVVNGHLVCPLDVAFQLVDAGVLISF